MDRPDKCPQCRMETPDIRGVIFDQVTGYASRRCDDPWHDVTVSSELRLTPEDRDLLAGMKVGF